MGFGNMLAMGTDQIAIHFRHRPEGHHLDRHPNRKRAAIVFPIMVSKRFTASRDFGINRRQLEGVIGGIHKVGRVRYARGSPATARYCAILDRMEISMGSIIPSNRFRKRISAVRNNSRHKLPTYWSESAFRADLACHQDPAAIKRTNVLHPQV